MEWKTVKLGEVCEILDKRRIPLSSMERESRRGKFPYYGAQGIIDYIDDYIFDEELLLVAEDGANLETRNEDIAIIASGKYWVNNHAHVLKDNGKLHLRLLHYLLNHMDITPYITGSAQPKLNQANLIKIELSIPDIETQHRIAAILSSLDDKIENNNRINRNLEAQAQALFKSWFVDFEPWGGTMPEDWKEGTLSNIADYLNGLAMQKFPAQDIENSLPVLKIKELGQRHCDESSDRCSKEIKSEYIIHDGDVIFSWSGTLLVDIWCGGDCGLNQHLFKVTSDKFPKWFYYLWTMQHLQNFKRIASDKAVTMGHIKRGDLDKSIVLIPNDKALDKMTAIMTPLLNSIISNAKESSRLATLRDTLLPKLMKGEIEV